MKNTSFSAIIILGWTCTYKHSKYTIVIDKMLLMIDLHEVYSCNDYVIPSLNDLLLWLDMSNAK